MDGALAFIEDESKVCCAILVQYGEGGFHNVLISGTRWTFQMIAPVRLTSHVSRMEIRFFVGPVWRSLVLRECFRGQSSLYRRGGCTCAGSFRREAPERVCCSLAGIGVDMASA